MSNPESTIIIPVHDKWELTRACLKSLAATLDKTRVEVIVIDNASSDATQEACAFLGSKLFGENFRYLRNNQNRNFAGASNQGAQAARGTYLVFLNNDTVSEAGWYEPLIEDFSAYPDLAATGPLLVYPDSGPLGRTVQHLGILVTPYLKFGHLYQGLPEASPLARKRRFFQAITGACFVIRKTLFMDVGQFDEGYINGFEDLDLCGRLCAKGWRFTINPNSVVVHHESQTPGRHARESENYSRLIRKGIANFRPDWHLLLNDDNFSLEIDEWLNFQPRLNREQAKSLEGIINPADSENLKKLLLNAIYWEGGWRNWLKTIRNPEEHMQAFSLYFNFFKTVPNAAKAIALGATHNNSALAQRGKNLLALSRNTPEDMLASAKAGRDWCQRIRLNDLAAQYSAWIDDYPHFKKEIHPLYIRKYFQKADTN